MSHFECTVCRETLENPTTLPCGHSFCRDRCLEAFRKDNTRCPLCREEMPPPPYRINIVLRDAIEASRKESENTPICMECEEDTATRFCPKCPGSYCDPCSRSTHQPKVLRSHSMVPIQQKKNVAPIKCSHHPTKNLEYFRTLCNVALCDACMFLKAHSHHPEEVVPLPIAKKVFNDKTKEVQVAVGATTAALDSTQERIQEVVNKVFVEGQSIFHSLIGDVIRQSISKEKGT
ncbi:hypothetical protein P9112_005145 [Eukaryota sp. TZLM1-RC]